MHSFTASRSFGLVWALVTIARKSGLVASKYLAFCMASFDAMSVWGELVLLLVALLSLNVDAAASGPPFHALGRNSAEGCDVGKSSSFTFLDDFIRCFASIISTTTACCRISSIGDPTMLFNGDHIPTSLLSEGSTSTLPLLNPFGSSFSTGFFFSPPHFLPLNISFHLSKGDAVDVYPLDFSRFCRYGP